MDQNSLMRTVNISLTPVDKIPTNFFADIVRKLMKDYRKKQETQIEPLYSLMQNGLVLYLIIESKVSFMGTEYTNDVKANLQEIEQNRDKIGSFRTLRKATDQEIHTLVVQNIDDMLNMANERVMNVCAVDNESIAYFVTETAN